MKKKLLSTTLVVAIALFFVYQKQFAINPIVDGNVEALTSGDPDLGIHFEITTEPIYKVESNPEAPGYWAPYKEYTVQGETIYHDDHSPLEWIIWFLTGGGPMSGDIYLCSTAQAQVQTTFHCYKIVLVD
ncbi:MAG: hypothetical protein IK038_09695 [Bacteroidaceae bacterium]|nr:hypothetical protein [Bacteroidaceae bacterium]